MKICPNCGTPAQSENQGYCMSCGAKLPEDSAPASVASDSAGRADGDPTELYGEETKIYVPDQEKTPKPTTSPCRCFSSMTGYEVIA